MGDHPLSDELRQWATGPMSRNPEHTDMCNTLYLAALELDALTRGLAKMSHRKCHSCGHIGYYTLNVLPECGCEKCGSADTRLIRPRASIDKTP